MSRQRTWESALEEAQVLFERQNREFDAAMSLAQQAGDVPVQVDEQSLRALAESTVSAITVSSAFPQSQWLSGSRC